MRLLLPAVAVCLLQSSLAGSIALALTGPQSDAPSPHAPSASNAPSIAAASTATASSAAAARTSSATADGDAAAKHAKRTACVKNAKAKKLVGAQKTAFIKECVAAP